jgi:hypothetical protein
MGAERGPVSGGGGGALDTIAVQSLDGALATFQRSVPGARVALDGVLLPAPLAYVARTDSLVTLQSDNVLAGWRWRSLAAAAEGGGGDAVKPDWKVNLGENAAWLLVGKTAGGGEGRAGRGGSRGASDAGALRCAEYEKRGGARAKTRSKRARRRRGEELECSGR